MKSFGTSKDTFLKYEKISHMMGEMFAHVTKYLYPKHKESLQIKKEKTATQ